MIKASKVYTIERERRDLAGGTAIQCAASIQNPFPNKHYSLTNFIFTITLWDVFGDVIPDSQNTALSYNLLFSNGLAIPPDTDVPISNIMQNGINFATPGFPFVRLHQPGQYKFNHLYTYGDLMVYMVVTNHSGAAVDLQFAWIVEIQER